MKAIDWDKPGLSLADVGEKALIEGLVRPLFNPRLLPWGVGDDSALTTLPLGHALLASTDRVPADLISFKAGVLGYAGLGAYLVRLNISDIAACGGAPIGLLLNLGLPSSLEVTAFRQLLGGVQDQASALGCMVLGGDLSDAAELSISATALGSVDPALALPRSGAQPGDTVFASRPLGLTPAAFRYLADRAGVGAQLSASAIDTLLGQFTRAGPMLELGQKLATSRQCTACMDNTDGLSQSLWELAQSSNVSLILRADWIQIPTIVGQVAAICGADPLDTALGAGADFSLVGTLTGKWTEAAIRETFGPCVRRIGFVDEGDGVEIQTAHGRTPVAATGWSYYS